MLDNFNIKGMVITIGNIFYGKIQIIIILIRNLIRLYFKSGNFNYKIMNEFQIYNIVIIFTEEITFEHLNYL